LIETGLYHKWITDALDYGWKMTSDPDSHTPPVYNEHIRKFTLSNSKIAIGPFIGGIFLSVLVLICEVVNHHKLRIKSVIFRLVLIYKKILTFRSRRKVVPNPKLEFISI